ncbi:MAG TPA: ligase-associated DNA damage response endonuclease PdeM [Methylibium sp.]|uniref:ligase-associated DNA damage response endonuclease PdeM n=1 Tax=Methylibium sp. TaxID=2067992 RepID=UPI002DB79BA5|nr:ligase-associated DNA damage response endonuclease PdeM [Methylibium sp.]HEU4458374.1 ligase-associated DNA damage response endonuclease PdeM [Methylibium sp.]
MSAVLSPHPQAVGCEHRVGGARLVLLPELAVWLPEQRTLLVADVHLGKAASFRRFGVPVPRGTSSESLDRLGALARACGAARIVVLGDFLHSAHAHCASTLGALARWRAAHADLAVTLVRGNHDAHAGDPPASAAIEVVDEPHFLPGLPGLALCHHPQPVAGAYVLAGHWHPCASIASRAGDRLRLPCFWFGDAAARPVGILPAFGSFTGKHPIDAAAGDRVWLIGDGRVVEWPRRAQPSASNLTR